MKGHRDDDEKGLLLEFAQPSNRRWGAKRGIIPLIQFAMTCSTLLLLLFNTFPSTEENSWRQQLTSYRNRVAGRPNTATPNTSSLVSNPPPAQEIHYLMTATKATHGLCVSLAAAMVHDAKPILLQWGAKQDTGAPSYWVARLGAVQNYVDTKTKDDDIVIMTDGYDAWLQKPLGEVIREFKQSGKRILFPAEKFCWVGRSGKVFEQREGFKYCDDALHSPLPEDLYGNRTDKEWKTTRPRWLNAGVVIGYAKDLRKMYESVMALQRESGTTDDQGLLVVTHFLNKDSISLDYYGDIVKSMASTEDDTFFAPRLPSSPGRPENSIVTPIASVSSVLLAGTTPRMIYDLNSKTFPGIVHFNGPGKDLILAYERKSWWTPHKDSPVTKRVTEFLHQQEIFLETKSNENTVKWIDICNDEYKAL